MGLSGTCGGLRGRRREERGVAHLRSIKKGCCSILCVSESRAGEQAVFVPRAAYALAGLVFLISSFFPQSRTEGMLSGQGPVTPTGREALWPQAVRSCNSDYTNQQLEPN